jgi:hypothetical protein
VKSPQNYLTEDDELALLGVAAPALIRLLDRRIDGALGVLRAEFHAAKPDLRPATATYVAYVELKRDLINKLEQRDSQKG